VKPDADVISNLARVLSAKTHLSCLFTAINAYRADRRQGSKSKMWQLPEYTIASFAIQCILEDMSVEDAIKKNKKSFDKLGYSTNRSVESWVSTLADMYAKELHRVTKKMVEDASAVPLDGNATNNQLQLAAIVQSKLVESFREIEDLKEIDPKLLNALSSVIGSLNGSIKVCADVQLTEAKITKMAEAIKGEMTKAKGSQSDLTPEQIAELIHDALIGSKDKQNKGAAA